MEERLKAFLELLKFNAIIYDDYISEDLESSDPECDYCKEYILSKDFVDYLYAKVMVNELTKTMDFQVKRNILEVVSFIRNNEKEEREDVINKINAVIVSLNGVEDENSDAFYQEQYLKRLGIPNKKNKFKISYEDEQDSYEVKKLIRRLMTLDYDAIIDVLERSEEELETEKIKRCLIDETFIYTLNKVKCDFPELYENELFKKRSISILKDIRKLSLKRNHEYKREGSKKIDIESFIQSTKLLRLLKK